MPAVLAIRPVRPDDFDFVAALTNRYIAGTSIHFGTEPVTAAELREPWLAHRARYPFFIGEADGRPVGYAKAGQFRTRAAYDWSAEVGIYLDQSCHGRGWGKALYAHLIDACRAVGFHSLIGGITLPNPASIRLHEALGFKHVGTFDRIGWKFGAWHPVAFYQLMLGEASHAPTPLP